MLKRFISIVIIISMTSLLLAGCASDSAVNQNGGESDLDPTTLKISVGVSDKHPLYIGLTEKFKPLVEEGTNGRYKVEVFPSAQLGDDTKSVEALRAGTLEMAVTSTAPLTGMIKELAIFDLPFLFTSDGIADKVLDSDVGEFLSSKFPEKDLVNLGWYEFGFRHLTNSVRPVETPEDLEGLKIRTMDNKYHLSTWKAMGANPTPMSWGEVFISLEQGAIDGQENPVPNFFSAGIHEVNPYITTTGHIYAPLVFLCSKSVYEKISEEDKAVLKEAAKQAGVTIRELNRKATQENLEAIREAGGTVTVLTPEQKKAFQEKTATVWTEIEDEIGSEIIDMLKAEIKKAAGK